MTDDAAGPSDFTAEVDQNIARNVRKARESHGLSQGELAARVSDLGVRGFHQTTIARIESGKRPLRAAEAIAVCRVLEINLEWLAESAASATARSEISWLRSKASEFDSAVQELLHSRRVTAMQLDLRYPYSDDGVADQVEVIRTGVDPHLYEVIEEVLVDSAPHARLENAYLADLHNRSLYARRRGNAAKGRLEYIAEEMQEWLERRDEDASGNGESETAS